ncbi:hypothetical protein ACT7DH_03760 [Bacillus pacificus]
MKSGDTLTLALPPELKGYSGTIPLKDDSGRILVRARLMQVM